MSRSTRLRAATAADLDAVVELEQRVFGPRTWSRATLAEELAAAPTSRSFLVADDPDRGVPLVIAYAVASYVAETAEVHRIAVDPAERRRGLGRRLLGALLDEADRRGCRRMLLEVAADNSEARALYAATGFGELHRRRRYYEGRVDAVVLELSLGDCAAEAPLHRRAQ